MLEKKPDGTILYVADPTHTQRTIGLRLSGKYTAPRARHDVAKNQTELIVDLPQEGFAGQTVSLKLQR
jgi:hypothetical protein